MIYDVSVRSMPLAAVIDLKGDTRDVVTRLQRLGLGMPAPGRVVVAGAVEVLRAGREHWLVRAPLADEDQLLATLREGGAAADTLILAVSDAYAFFDIAGPHARQIMAIASPLAVDPGVFAPDSASFTEAFGQKALVLRRETGFEIGFERSYAPMAADYFSRINGGL